MIARITTELPCGADEFWRRITDPRSLRYVAWPVLSFAPFDASAFDRDWQAGNTYELKLSLFGLLPLGRHGIHLVSVDPANYTIQTQERGLLTPIWNHTLQFHPSGRSSVRYTDTIDVGSNWLSPGVWLFAQLFFRHRHRRWKRLLRQEPLAGTP